MALKQTKEKIHAVQKTHKVTHAMEAVSAVKMRKSQQRALEARPYARNAYAILKRVLESNVELAHPLMEKNTSEHTLLLVVTSDKGLAGGLNSAVLKEIDSVCSGLDMKTVRMVAVGKKAVEYARRKNIEVVHAMENVSDGVSVSDMRALSDLLTRLYTDNTFGACKMIYTHFISTLRNDVRVRDILPVNARALEKAVKWTVPKEGKYSELQEENHSGAREYVFEPSPEAVLEELVPHLLNVEVYHALLEAKASEHSARMIAMKNATDRAQEVSKELQITYNKQRQAAITGELIDIVGGAAASSN